MYAIHELLYLQKDHAYGIKIKLEAETDEDADDETTEEIVKQAFGKISKKGKTSSAYRGASHSTHPDNILPDDEGNVCVV